MRIKYENPKLKQSEIANQLGYSSSTLQRYRNEINMVSPYRIQPNNSNKRTKKTSNTTSDNDSHREPDVKGPQMTSKQLKQLQNQISKTKINILKAGPIRENIEINDQYLDETLDNSDI